MNGQHLQLIRPRLALLRAGIIFALLISPLSAVYAQDTDQTANTVFLPFAANQNTQTATDQQASGPTEQAEVIAAAPVGQGFNLNAGDLRFIMQQIRISERHAATRTAANPCGTLVGSDPDQIPTGTGQTIELPWGLRTVDGSCNHLSPGQATFGTADQVFPRVLSKELRAAQSGSYNDTTGTVTDSQPRLISNLIVDQTASNAAALAAAGDTPIIHAASGSLFIPNTAPDVGLSAPFNSWFTLFGQFFDHGLDLVNKGGNGTVFIPLQADDPLFVTGSPTNFMVLTRATQVGNHEAINQTTPWVDQSQTYTSHPSHQVFLRRYTLDAGRPVGTGKLITGTIGGGMATWADLKAQALTVLGIQLSDQDALSVPLLATDPYGRFLRGPNGFPQIVTTSGLVEGNPAAPITTAGAIPTGHAFLDDIAHTANPNNVGYNSALLNAHFIAGDGRVNENIGLTAVHHVFHSEHNRLVGDIWNLINTPGFLTPAEVAAWSATTGPSGWDLGERLFQAARFVTEMEYQHLAFEEFIRKVQPMVNVFGGGGTGFNTSVNPAISAEFAHAVYRFGHSMLTESVDRIRANGTPDNIDLLAAFLNPPAFLAGYANADEAAGAIVRGMTSQVGNEIDEFVTEALRNRLLGLPLDLATLNMARARETGIPRLNQARREFFAASQNSALTPYESWIDFGFAIRNPQSLYNFVAAYGTHPSITSSTTMVARRAAAARLIDLNTTSLVRYAVLENPGAPCLSTEWAVVDLTAANAIVSVCYASSAEADANTLIVDQNTAVNNFITDATDFLYSTGAYAPVNGRTTSGVDDIDLWVGGLAEKQMVFGGLLGPTFNYIFEKQMEDLQDGDRFYYLSRTAGLNLLVQLEGNSFAELIQRNTDAEALPADVFSRPAYVFNVANLGTTGPILNDPTTPYTETQLLTRMPNGTIRYAGPEHVVFNGTGNNDRVWSSEGDDTIRGNDANDWMQGGDGNDNHIGGLGDDILLDSAGDDTLKGGDGNDVLSSGQGFAGDLNQGGRGNDYIIGGNDTTESFAGPGNDYIYAGDSEDTVFGDDGDDWIEAGRGPFNLLQGDNGAPFQNDLNQPGHDVLIGYGGEQDYDAEGGDDIMLMGPGIQRAEGMLGFDWSTHKSDQLPADSDMRFTVLLPPTVENNRDRFDLTEGLSGWIFNDTLRGDDRTVAEIAPDHTLNAAGIARITDLAALLPAGATSFSGGNILIGGDGSDTIEGRGGDDLIDGDRWLDVQIRINGSRPSALAEFHDVMGTLNAAVVNGQINPGQLTIVRTIRAGTAPADCAAANPVNCDIAVFSDVVAAYTITQNPDGSLTVDHNGGVDGVDTLRNIERLQFLDGIITNLPPSGAVTISSSTPAENGVLNVTNTIVDPEGVGPISYIWQAETATTVWTDVGTGSSFTPSDNVVGRPLRVVASYTDGANNFEQLISAPTAPVTAVNDPPTGLPTLSSTTPVVGVQISAITTGIADVDGLGPFSYQWRANGTPIAGATAVNFTPTAAQVGQTLSVVVSYTDLQGFAESLASAASAAVTAAPSGGGVVTLPATLDFGRRRTATTKVVSIDNTGTAPLTVTAINVSGAPFTVTGTCGTIAPGRRCRVNVTFTPTAAQAYQGTLTVVSNATNSPTVMNLTGSGR